MHLFVIIQVSKFLCKCLLIFNAHFGCSFSLLSTYAFPDCRSELRMLFFHLLRLRFRLRVSFTPVRLRSRAVGHTPSPMLSTLSGCLAASSPQDERRYVPPLSVWCQVPLRLGNIAIQGSVHLRIVIFIHHWIIAIVGLIAGSGNII